MAKYGSKFLNMRFDLNIKVKLNWDKAKIAFVLKTNGFIQCSGIENDF